MRRVTSIVLFLVSCVGYVLAATAKNKAGTFDSAYMDKLLAMSPDGLIRLNELTFDAVIGSPRDYAVAVLLTAEAPSMGCQLCRQFSPDYSLVAHSYHVDHPFSGDGLYIAVLDFKDGQKIFQRLQIKSAPNVWLYLPTEGPNASNAGSPIIFDMQTLTDIPQNIIKFLETYVPELEIIIHRPADYSKIGSIITGLAVAGIALRYMYPLLRPIIESRTIWAGLSLIGILMFISGHMFNNIRHTPYVTGDRNGGIQYIAPAFSQQYGFETQIIAVLYAFLAFSAISLAIKVPRISDSTKQLLSVTTWVVIIWAMFSVLMFIFRIKNRGYPFSIPPMSK
ncbi:uncharacterized protein V1516DRAFT_638141 [Lipomyces oligophaga]|uniref:uncharacterized protein n=1 Tax=Lipomyces oligophaga TaxID=45792 RepID=UPI0034CEEE23